MLSIVCIFSIGYSNWTISEDDTAPISIHTNTSGLVISSSFLDINNLYGNGNGIEQLKYNSKGFVFDEVVSYVGHLKYYLVFNSASFYSYVGASSNTTIKFGINFTYKNGFVDGYSLISSNYLTINLIETNENTNEELSLKFSPQGNAFGTSNDFVITSASEKLNLVVDCVFNVQNYETFMNIWNNELTKGVIFNLSIYIEGMV